MMALLMPKWLAISSTVIFPYPFRAKSSPALSRIVKEVCAEHGVPCRENITLMDALRSHYNFVRQMGLKPAEATVATRVVEPAH